MELLEAAKPAAEADEKIEYSPARMQGCIQIGNRKSRLGQTK